MNKNELKSVLMIDKEIELIDRQLSRHRNPVEGQEREKLLSMKESLQSQYNEAVRRLDDLISTYKDARIRIILRGVLLNGYKQKEIAQELDLTEGRVSQMFKAAVDELNKKGAAEATPADH